MKLLHQITYQGYIFLGYRTNYIRFNICIKIGTYLLAAILFIVQTASWPTCWRLRLRKITYFKRVLGIIERERTSLGHFTSVEQRGWKKIFPNRVAITSDTMMQNIFNPRKKVLSFIFPKVGHGNSIRLLQITITIWFTAIYRPYLKFILNQHYI